MLKDLDLFRSNNIVPIVVFSGFCIKKPRDGVSDQKSSSFGKSDTFDSIADKNLNDLFDFDKIGTYI
ncbi:hypothetical protein AYI70_g6970 [Smittium culicis]|uniref:XPG N-terminal domain-containing protein n=1 Tax=Smittium culicis TaxID=133412 RepID=A0A1R1XMN5_9FUNG|nr:hypothetical protein AYI70_g6970 [Smittium culicis]